MDRSILCFWMCKKDQLLSSLKDTANGTHSFPPANIHFELLKINIGIRDNVLSSSNVHYTRLLAEV